MIADNAAGLEHKVSILTRLAETTVVLNSSRKLKTLLSDLMNTAAEIVGAEGASVLLWDARHNELRFAATTTGDASQSLIGRPVPLEGSLAGAIWREQRTLMVEDTGTDPRHYRQVDQSIAFQTRSLLGVPMRSKQRVIGVLEAVNKRTPPWNKDDARYLEILAAQAAVAIEGAQMLAALQKANDELAHVDKLKSDFIALASHELRTPLGVILGYATFLQENEDTGVRGLADKVVDSALQLRRIIEDLTNLRFLEQQDGELHLSQVPLRLFVDEAVADARVMANANSSQLFVGPLPDLDLTIDRMRLGRALNNMLINAIRFTPHGGEIGVEAEVRGRELWLKVRDNGIGIAPENLDRIFERFLQVEEHMTRQYGGMGIGLSIARGLVEAHGGRLWATSPGLNQGSTFIMALPLSSEVSGL
jgi:signal transduction histidine kinase